MLKRSVRGWLEQEDNRKHFDRIIFCVFLETEQACYEQLMSLYFPHPGTPYALLPKDEHEIEASEEEDAEVNEMVTFSTNMLFYSFLITFSQSQMRRRRRTSTRKLVSKI